MGQVRDMAQAEQNPVSPQSATPPLLRLSGLTKRFGDLVANDAIDLAIAPGEIHAILGENGAGKSTLMKMIYGVLAPDAGTIAWQGTEVSLRNPAHARDLGIGMVFQHFSLFDSLTVAENISLSIRGGVRRLRTRIRDVSERFGLPVDPDTLVHSLSMGERQRVEIIRCLLQEPKLIIMDEPTSVLPPGAVETLFRTIRSLAESGVAVLFISHKLDEIRVLCHKATVMRAGRVAATVDPTAESSAALARLMIGRDIPHPRRKPAAAAATPALEVHALSAAPPDPFGTHLRDINLTVHPGEIVGIAGVSGNGQRELAELLSGERILPRAEAGAIRLLGTESGHFPCSWRRARGMAYVSEDRNGRGSVPEMSLEKNTLLTAHDHGLVSRLLVRRDRVSEMAAHCIEEMDVRCSGPRAEARSLSGGNLQKFIIGRELSLKPRLLVAAQPTWGVDVGAAQAIRQKLVDLREEGVAILVISDELEELIDTADRLHVLFRGRLSPSIARAEATEDMLGRYMAGDFLAAPETATAGNGGGA